MQYIIPILLLSLLSIHCKQEKAVINRAEANKITCNDHQCMGTYIGAEFINQSDIAHQFSNSMSKAVGDQLKNLYDQSKYSMVDFEKISMSTEGMGSGNVTYDLVIPFKRVDEKCEAYTSFDHVGGWNHRPALDKRKKELSSLLLIDEKLNISSLKKTREGLQEYWIQWKNKNKQAECAGVN